MLVDRKKVALGEPARLGEPQPQHNCRSETEMLIDLPLVSVRCRHPKLQSGFSNHAPHYQVVACPIGLVLAHPCFSGTHDQPSARLESVSTAPRSAMSIELSKEFRIVLKNFRNLSIVLKNCCNAVGQERCGFVSSHNWQRCWTYMCSVACEPACMPELRPCIFVLTHCQACPS